MKKVKLVKRADVGVAHDIRMIRGNVSPFNPAFKDLNHLRLPLQAKAQ
jgi:hypothetical protein